MVKIRDWADLAEDFKTSLLVGNGASIAIAESFRYSALLDAAHAKGLISDAASRVFEYIKTPDFELALTWLWHTYHVNQALGVHDQTSTVEYQLLRAALIQVVHEHHVLYKDAHDRLPKLADFLTQFKTVISLNYDLIIYWVMMGAKEKYGNWFKDAFLHGEFVSAWEFLRTNKDALGTTMVFYPHGNLALATDLNGLETKLSVPFLSLGPKAKLVERNLLKEITTQWETASVTPLFVSEGTSEQKIAAINRSVYLRNVWDTALPNLGPTIAIYGWSASQADLHILTQICRGSDRLAFSVLRHDDPKESETRCMEIEARVQAIGGVLKKAIDVQFYWADGEGTWGAAAS